MNTEVIGTNAGTVWEALNGAEALAVKQLKKITKLISFPSSKIADSVSST